MANRQTTRFRLLIAFMFGGVLAVSVGSGVINKQRALSILSWFGGAYSNAYVVANREPSEKNSSEYLVVLRDTQNPISYVKYIEQHPKIDYLSESVYPNTIRVTLQIPVSDAIDDLKAQPFVGFVIRNLPIFFCH